MQAIITTVFVCSLVLAVVSIGEASTVSEDIKSNFLESDLMTWVPPKEFLKNFTYYLSGHDDDGRPVWIAEWGRWNVRKYVEKGGEALETLNKYVDQLALNQLNSLNANLTESGTTQQIIAIVDLEGYNYEQLGSAATLSYYLSKFGSYGPLIEKYVKIGYIINANYVAETAISLVKPVLGKAFEPVEVYGTNKAKWQPRLRRHIPKRLLPEWYGGSENYAPLKIFG